VGNTRGSQTGRPEGQIKDYSRNNLQKEHRFSQDFQIIGTFSRISQKGIIVGENPEAKIIEKTLLQEYNFFRIFLLNRFLSCKHSKIQVTYDQGCGR
jgi:hypothetical protein